MINRLGLVLFWTVFGYLWLAILAVLLVSIIVTIPVAFIITGDGEGGMIAFDWWGYAVPKKIAYWFGVNLY